MLRTVFFIMLSAIVSAGGALGAIPEPSAGVAAASITVSATVLDAGPSAAALRVVPSLLASGEEHACDWTREGLARIVRVDSGMSDDPPSPDAVIVVEFVAN